MVVCIEMKGVPVQRNAAPPDQLAMGQREGQTDNYLGGRQDAGAMIAHYYALITHIDDHIPSKLRFQPIRSDSRSVK